MRSGNQQGHIVTDFLIDKPSFDAATGKATFRYGLGEHRFTETLVYPEGGSAAVAATASFAKLLDLTAIVLGTSYFKLLAPELIRAPSIPLTADERAFAIDIYENGLGEFYARNGLRRFGRLAVAGPNETRPAPAAPILADRVLLPIGGGKDSLVSARLLEQAGIDFTPFAVNPKGPIITSVDRLARPPVYVTRTLDPEMIRLGQQPGFLNGHVPSTAINSMIAALAALLFGYDRIVLSNERSASQGNAQHDGREVNHQYSKSMAFEHTISRLLASATGSALHYFSLLRPLSEARIAGLFAEETRFDRVFSSCNRNFRYNGHDGPLWCGQCPKCHFVFLILAPVMDKHRLVGIFGKDLLDVPENEPSFRELTGLAGQKPWECVGEIEEAAACLHLLASRPEWSETCVVSRLKPDLLTQYGNGRLESAHAALLADSPDHHVPPELSAKVFGHAV